MKWRNIAFVKGGILILALSATTSNQSIAASKKFPNGCREVNFSFHDDIIEFNRHINVKTQPQTLYLVHNLSYNDIKLEVPRPQKYLPTFTKKIPPGSWAALAKDDNPLQLACYSDSGYYSSYTDSCSSMIEICNYNNAKFPPHNIGTYWLDRTGPRQNVMHYAIRKGILLRW